MKKILLAFDGTHFSNGAFQFARQLNELEPALVTGAFLPQAQAANLWSYADGMSGPMFVPLVEERDTEVIKENIEKFEASTAAVPQSTVSLLPSPVNIIFEESHL